MGKFKKLKIIESKISSNDWLLNVKLTGEKRNKLTEKIIQEIEQFPLSDYQEVYTEINQKLEEVKKYLKLQHGNNIT